jgi:signal transduction histidine kinase
MIINSKIDFFTKKWEKWKIEKDDLEQLLKSIKSNTKKLNKLLETLFLLSRYTEWIEDFKKEKQDLSNYITDFVSSFTSSYDSKDIKLDFKIEKNIILEIEVSTFNIIIENLLTNAIKFGNTNLQIEVWLDKNMLYIKDNWVWISEENLSKIWDKFYRSDVNIEWFGVWLFIVKRISDLYGWKIEVESELWVWSKFIILFKKNENTFNRG